MNIRFYIDPERACLTFLEKVRRHKSEESCAKEEIQELEAVLGLGQAKIAQFEAVIEMSKRYLAECFQDRPYVESSEDILKLLYQEMRDLDQEVFKVVY